MKKILTYLLLISILTACSTSNLITRTPEQDKNVYELIDKLSKNQTDGNLQKDFEDAYATAVLAHQAKINTYKSSDAVERWEQVMIEYGHLKKLSQAVKSSPAASKLVNVQSYDELYAEAKSNATDAYYSKAKSLLNVSDRDASKDAYTLLQKADNLTPGYKDTKALMNKAYNESILNVVVVPVNYYAQSYGYWGLQNDYVQQELVRDLRFQLGSGSVKVYSEQEARSQRIVPDRFIELRWDELFMPQPYTQTFTKNLSRQIQTGVTKDNQPIYTTVNATLYVTRREVRAGGNLMARVSDQSGQTILSDYFPSNYNYVQENATYRGDVRALGSYELSLLNNSRMNNYGRRDIFSGVLQQVYPQLLSRLRGIIW